METYLGYKLEKQEIQNNSVDGKSHSKYISWEFVSPDGEFTGSESSREKARAAIKVHKESKTDSVPAKPIKSKIVVVGGIPAAQFIEEFKRDYPEEFAAAEERNAHRIVKPTIEVHKVEQKPKQELLYIRFHGWWASGYESTLGNTEIRTLRILNAPHAPYNVGRHHSFKPEDIISERDAEGMARTARRNRRFRKAVGQTVGQRFEE